MITITEKALKEVQRLMKEDTSLQPGAALRVQVVGGGCSGMSYKLGFENNPPASDDDITEAQGFKVYVDAKSNLYLNGMTLDFSDGLNGTGFVFNNPNAKRTCGCGSSFSA